jgi:hypothetical protein
MIKINQFQFNLNIVILNFNFNLEVKSCVKTRLVTKTCQKRDLPSAHDRTSFLVCFYYQPEDEPWRVETCSWLTYYFYKDVFLTVVIYLY